MNERPISRPQPSLSAMTSRPVAQQRTSPDVTGQFDSMELLKGASCIAIRHHGERYWLRATRQGKLLLTK